jgi:hypothetical protein
MPETDPPPDPCPNSVPALGATEQHILRWLSRANGKDIDPVQAHFNRAQAQVLLQRWHDALASLDAVIDLNPEHAQAHEMRLRLLSRLDKR